MVDFARKPDANGTEEFGGLLNRSARLETDANHVYHLHRGFSRVADIPVVVVLRMTMGGNTSEQTVPVATSVKLNKQLDQDRGKGHT